MKPTKKQQYLVARRAMRGVGELPPTEQIELYGALAAMLPRQEAEVARSAAFLVQAAEQQQLKFLELIADPPSPAMPRSRKRAVRRAQPRKR